MAEVYMKDPVVIPRLVAERIGYDIKKIDPKMTLIIEREELISELKKHGQDILARFYEARRRKTPAVRFVY